MNRGLSFGHKEGQVHPGKVHPGNKRDAGGGGRCRGRIVQDDVFKLLLIFQ